MDKRITLLLLLTACTAQVSFDAEHKAVFHSNPNVSVSLEIASTPAEMAEGLMYRQSLAQDAGMLFIFPEEKEVSFWMKNMHIPLDMFFIGEDGKITKVHHATPCKEDPCQFYKGTAKYVIETNTGFSDKNNIIVGDKVTLPEIKQ